MNPTPPEYLRPATCIRSLDNARIGELRGKRKRDGHEGKGAAEAYFAE